MQLCTDAGLGLFTTEEFKCNAIITEYCGTFISHEQAHRLREAGRDSHVRALASQHQHIDGLKQPVQGRGGASFANDARTSRGGNNACWHTM